MAIKQVFNTSAELDYPTVLPTLDLDFANSKTLDPRITFTRASGGSYVGADGLIKYAGVNEARFTHDPVTLESLGLLVEEQRTNLLLRSEEFDNASWVKARTSVSPNAATAPNGTTTADRLTEDGTASNTHVCAQVFTFAATTYTFSVFAKADRRSWIRLFAFDSVTNFGCYFNLSAGAVGTAANSTGTIQALGDGWYHCRMIFTAAVGSGTVAVRLATGDNGNSYSGDNTSGIYFWGAQLEVGSFPTSYIPTLSTTRTRAADDARMTGKNFSDFYRQNEGTVLIDTISPRGYEFTPSYWIFQNSSGNILGVYNNVAPSGSNQIYIAQIPQLTGGFVYSQKFTPSAKIIFSYSNSYFLAYINTNISNTSFRELSSGANLPANNISSFRIISPNLPTFNAMLIGGGKGYNIIKRLTYYPKQLTYSNSTSLLN